MKKPTAQLMKDLSVALLDKDKSDKIIGLSIYAILFVVSVFMTVVNLITKQPTSLVLCTGIFGLCNAVCLGLALMSKRGVRIASHFITVSFYAMFVYFLIYGIPDGFSALWISVLPPVSMLFYGRKRGSVICASMLLVLILLLWTPLGNLLLQHEYFSAVFKMRFPILYFAFYAIAFILESLRAIALNEAKKLSNDYKQISIRDQLTGVFNRTGMLERLENDFALKTFHKAGFIIADIDFFKRVNDVHGHMIGDKVLVDFAKILCDNLNATVCRWGGEEFAMVYYDDGVTIEDAQSVLSKIENHEFVYEDLPALKITASMGVFETTDHNLDNFDKWMQKADRALYNAKNSGRNTVKYF